jgi:hypothetical protein
MSTHAILIQNSVQALNNDSLNRSVKSSADIDNGFIFNLLELSTTTGEGEVWVASTPVTSYLSNLWMAYEPEVVTVTVNSKSYKGIDPDVRDFYNVAGDVFTGFKPQLGDILTITAAGLTGTKGTNTFVTAVTGKFTLEWGASAISGLSCKLLETTYVSISDGSIGLQRVTAYRFEVVAIA